jgi:hypothetical protein
MPFGGLLTAGISAGGSILGGLFGGGGGAQADLYKKLLEMAGKDSAQRNQIIKSTEAPLSYFYAGDPTQSGLYRDFVTSGMESTADAFNNAKANVAQRANMSGFGYNQPIAQGAQDEVNNEQAKASAQVPRQALQSTIAPELEALNIRANEAHNYNPAAYTSSAGGPAAGADNQTSGLFSSLFNTAQGGLASDIGNLFKKKSTPSSGDTSFVWDSGGVNG